MDLNETQLKNNYTITTDYLQNVIDTSSFSAKFKINGSHLSCVSTEEWGNLPEPINEPVGNMSQLLCITNITLLATFKYYMNIQRDGSYTV